ncbi:MAG TPA: DNA-3-methyladenine glycosylase [Cyclobacteriaceae bacterium]|nr:DNA-3-methyladenine glycosylase [Cyclobacteriaceae bacterium]
MDFIIPVPEAFNFSHCVSYLRRSPKELLHVFEGDTLIKVIRASGHSVLFSVRYLTGEGIRVDMITPRKTALVSAVEKYVREWFDLDTDLRPFFEMASKDKLLKPLAAQYYGYRIVGLPDLFESLVWAVIGQQINLGFAHTLKQRFVEHFGERLTIRGATYYLFPEPGVIAQLHPEDLLTLQFSRQKSRYIIGLARAFASGEISREKLQAMEPGERMETLLSIKGIGSWTANYVLMRTFRYPEAFPLGDAGLNTALRRLLKLDRKPTSAEVQRIFQRYRGWEAYATLYFWKSL